ncbi:MAG: hypothetical protein KDC43_29365 [Saprospiraceae bacterium]|nr:hypothetical protein [Saprospiraceae bacterium]
MSISYAVSVGTDPEGFAVDKSGKYRSVIGLLGGSKANPKKTKNGYIQEDNVAWEVNTFPAFNREDFIMNVLGPIQDIRDILTPLDLSIDISPVALFHDDELQDDKAKIAGCSVDFNAWTGEQNHSPDLSKTNMRSAGGHLWIGTPILDNIAKKMKFIRVMDQVAGVPSVIMDPNVERRKLYGKAGSFRMKDESNGDSFTGVEYRTLSNFWLKTPETIGWAFDTVMEAVNRFDEFDHISDIHADWIVNIINTSNVKDAKLFCETFNIKVA